MKTIHFTVSFDFEPAPDKDDIERFIEQMIDILDCGHHWDFCGSVELGEITLYRKRAGGKRKAK